MIQCAWNYTELTDMYLCIYIWMEWLYIVGQSTLFSLYSLSYDVIDLRLALHYKILFADWCN